MGAHALLSRETLKSLDMLKSLLPLLLLALAMPLVSGQDDDETPLTRAMGVLQGSTRALGKVVEDPAQRDEALRLLGLMEEAALVSAGEAAPAPDGMEGTELALFQVGFRRSCLSLADAILEAEAACISGNAEGLKAAYATILQRKKAGHNQYK